MNLKILSDQNLLIRIDELVKKESALLTEILHHLREVERRRLFSELGFKHIFEYAVKRLGYPEDQAARRVAAMRLLHEFPEIESKIADGTLSLTNLNLAQTLFRANDRSFAPKFNREQKIELLNKLEGQTKREGEAIIYSQSEDLSEFRPDRARFINTNNIEFRFVGTAQLQNKIERVRGLLAHSKPDLNMAQTLEHSCDITIAKLDPSVKVLKTAPALKPRVDVRTKDENPDAGSRVHPFASRQEITLAVRRSVWKRAHSRCENCHSTYALEVDHRIPRGLGGTNRPDNLRLLCRSCNQRKAINAYGMKKMEKHLEKDAIDQVQDCESSIEFRKL